MMSPPSIFLSAIKVCRQQIGIIIKVKSNSFDCTVYRILHFQKIVFVCCLHILYKRVRANCHQHKTIWWHGRLWLYCILDHHHHPESLEREEKSFKVCYVFFSLLLVGWMKKGQSFAIRCFWYPKKYNICDQLHTPACQNLSHLFRIGRKSVINQTDSVG